MCDATVRCDVESNVQKLVLSGGEEKSDETRRGVLIKSPQKTPTTRGGTDVACVQNYKRKAIVST